MLIQAESRSGTCETITIERVKEVLEQDFNIPAEQIALAAYEHDDLAGVDVLSPTCPYRFVVTVAKLPEGWDCPFCYGGGADSGPHPAPALCAAQRK